MRQKSAFSLQVSSTKSIAAQQAACVNVIGTGPVLIDGMQKTTVVAKTTHSQRLWLKLCG